MLPMSPGRPTAARWLRDARGVGLGAKPLLDREGEGEAHADGDGLAMEQPVGIAGIGLQGMAEGVAEIEQRPGAALLALVGLDDRRLGAAARGDGVGAVAAFAGEDLRPALLEPSEERGIAEEPVFHHFGVARAELAGAERVEHGNVGEHEARLMEGADQVLALGGVDAGLAADGGIDLGEERGRDLHQPDAAAEDACGEAAEIADDATAERHDRVAALDAELEQLLRDLGEHREAFARFAGRHHHLAEEEAAEARLQALQIKPGHRRVADHGAAGAGHRGGNARAGAVEQRRADDDVIAPLAKTNPDRGLVSAINQSGEFFCHHSLLPRRRGAVLASSSRKRTSASTRSDTMTS